MSSPWPVAILKVVPPLPVKVTNCFPLEDELLY